MCFDTTSSNTGKKNGAAYLLEKKLGRPLLFCACHHHIDELLLGKAFQKTIESVTAGPDILLFTKFKSHWPNINLNNFKSCLDDQEVVQFFPWNERINLIDFIKSQLEHSSHERSDYKEFLTLALIFFDGAPVGTIIRKPGAVSRARWMGKAIYTLKIYLFREEFPLPGNNFIFLIF